MLACNTASAAKIYQVELIVFSHITPQAINSEQWPSLENTTTDYKNTINLSSSPNGHPYFSLLSPHDFILKNEQRRLNGHPDYHTLLHISWRQPVYAPHDSRAVHIYGGQAYDDRGNALLENNNENQPYESQTHWQVNGTVNVSVQHYLDLNVDLVLTAPVSQLPTLSSNTNAASNLLHFHLLQSRRMRSDEINYIDFPLYGVLVKIVPVKI